MITLNTPLQQYIVDIGISSSEITEDTTLKEITQQVYEETGKYSSLVGFGTYLSNNSVDETLANVKVFFRALLPEDIDAYIRDILIPKFRATLLLSLYF